MWREGCVSLLMGLAVAQAVAACGPAEVPVRSESVAERRVKPPAWRRSCTSYAKAPVHIDYQDASGGAAVLYTTRGDVAALRERTQKVAEFHNSSQPKLGAMHELYHLPHQAYVENLPQGAKLVLVSKRIDLASLAELRRNVQQEVLNMQRRGCGTGQEAL